MQTEPRQRLRNLSGIHGEVETLEDGAVAVFDLSAEALDLRSGLNHRMRRRRRAGLLFVVTWTSVLLSSADIDFE